MKVKLAAVALCLLASAAGRERPAGPTPSRVDAVFIARKAFYLQSDLPATLNTTAVGLRLHPDDPELLFLRMQAAELQADSATVLDSAIRLCRAQRLHPDARGFIAAGQILELATNSEQFRTVVPQIEHLIAAGSPFANDLRDALVQAAANGVPNLSLLANSHAAGLITDWKLAGPFGKYSYADFDRSFSPELDSLKDSVSAGHPVERVRYADGSLALPDYFSHGGVFYAASTITFQAPVTRILSVDSTGTVQLFIDGKSTIRKDDRFRDGPEVVLSSIRLTAGPHTLLVKFISDALPMRIALLPETAPQRIQVIPTYNDEADDIESPYIAALIAYRRGDYQGAIAQLASVDEHAFAAGDLLLAESWSQISDDSPEALSYLTSAIKLAPASAKVNFLLAQSAKENGRDDEAWQRISQVIAAQPKFASAQRLAFNIANSNRWTVEAIAASDAEIAAAPTCEALTTAHDFYFRHEQFQRAKALESSIEGCAPGSTDYANLLSTSGRHAESAKSAAKLVAENPFSRTARHLLVRELALAGRSAEAHEAAVELAHLAPNSTMFRRMSEKPADSLLFSTDDTDGRSVLAGGDPFYSPFRRNTLPIAHQPTPHKYSGIPAVALADDKVSRLAANGSVSVYVHRVLRVITREGIEKFGEVSIPENAHILELRTLKADGTIAEPEFSQHKDTISMPALSPGDVIDEEYVVYYPDGGIEKHQKDFSFTFGSHDTPVEDARFVSITPESIPVTTRQFAGAPNAFTSLAQGQRVQVWEQRYIPRFDEETSVPARPSRPTVVVYTIPQNGWFDVRDSYRDKLIGATRIGPRTLASLAGLHLENLSAEEKLSRIYAFVSEKISDDRSSLGDDIVASAEETFATSSGNRSIALIALACAAGLDADLLLARDLSSPTPLISDGTFTKPVVRIRFPLTGKLLFLDPQTPGMTLGAIAPKLDRHEALLVPLHVEDESGQPLIAFSSRQTEQSTAAGDLRLHRSGELDARVTITLGSWRTAQMRSTLQTTEPADRAQFFRDIANRIFAGATGVRGEVRNEHNLDAPLQIVLSCRVEHFLDFSALPLSVNQLVPALGLRRMYAASSSRSLPLFVDTPLSELTIFRLTLPPEIQLTHRITNVELHNKFGRYRVSSRIVGANALEITREFEIPVQVISPGQYPDFVTFAARIEDAERERFTLSVNGDPEAVQSSGN